jgi:hypothetical protein
MVTCSNLWPQGVLSASQQLELQAVTTVRGITLIFKGKIQKYKVQLFKNKKIFLAPSNFFCLLYFMEHLAHVCNNLLTSLVWEKKHFKKLYFSD